MAGTLQVDTITNAAGTGPVSFSTGLKRPNSIKDIANANYTITDTDGFEMVTSLSALTADRTVTLPAAANNVGREILFKKTDSASFKLIIAAAGTDTIDGAAANRIVEQYGFIRMRCVSTSLWCVEACTDLVSIGSATNANAGGTLVYADVSANPLVVPEGEWEISASVYSTANGATTTFVMALIATASGNVVTGSTVGKNIATTLGPTAANDFSVEIQNYSQRFTTATNLYLKVRFGYSAGTPQYTYYFQARRIG